MVRRLDLERSTDAFAGSVAGTLSKVKSNIREVRIVYPHWALFLGIVAAMSDYLGEACPLLCSVDTPVQAIKGAQIIVTATTSPTLVFPGKELEPGTLVVGVG